MHCFRYAHNKSFAEYSWAGGIEVVHEDFLLWHFKQKDRAIPLFVGEYIKVHPDIFIWWQNQTFPENFANNLTQSMAKAINLVTKNC